MYASWTPVVDPATGVNATSMQYVMIKVIAVGMVLFHLHAIWIPRYPSPSSITLDVKRGSSSTPFQTPTICGWKVPQIHSHPSMKPTLKQENRSTSAGAGLPETPPFTEEALKFGSFICSFSDHRPKYYILCAKENK